MLPQVWGALFEVDFAVANDRLDIVQQGVVSPVVGSKASVLNLPVPAEVDVIPMVWSSGMESNLAYSLSVSLTNQDTVTVSATAILNRFARVLMKALP